MGKRQTWARTRTVRRPCPVSRFPGGVRERGVAMRVEQVRGGVVEAVHEGHVAVVDSTGGLVARGGDPELVTVWRSAAEALQALPPLGGGGGARVGPPSGGPALAG